MGEVVFYVVAFTVSALAPYSLWYLMRSGKHAMDDWPAAAASLGLVVTQRERLWRHRVVAECDRLRATFSASQGDQEHATWTHIVVARRDRPAHAIWIELSSLAQLAAGRPPAADVTTGDHGFDRAATLLGPATHLLATLDAATRARLIFLARNGPVTVVSGEVQVTVDEGQLETARRRHLESVIAVSDRLFGELDLEVELARNAREDPHPGARERNLAELARTFRGAPRTQEVLRAALADASPAVRIRAACELGEEGREFLQRVTEDDAAGDEIVAAAIRALGAHFGADRVERMLKPALRARRGATAAACIERLGAGDVADAVATLSRILRVERGPLAIAAAGALGRLAGSSADPAAEGPLVEALATEDREVALAVVEALERVATVAAIAPLSAAAERNRRVPGLLQAVRRAIAAIQSRVPGAAHGQLSLAPALGGSISLAPEQSGQLSLADDPAGKISAVAPPVDRQ
ncbi:hypothetical protein [Amaricoccus sp.]|uniref:hypothetical protein n=1 Tax=Amaricoccus sp. TaxID=1872485 RepID=UPI001B58B1B3|nr:hypothetical protein [Amaricoccus sp.]MBP7243411.1 hypothetical protein [Amaricoccus sp.]